MRFIKTIPPEIRDLITRIREVAQEKYGLDFFETIFEMVDYKTMNEIAAFGGFPTRYPHWRFGMEYDQLSKSHTYGLSKIYEMVINNDPSYAYLLEGNNIVDQKTVIAHVYAHVDFFKNNYYFSKTNRNMVDEMANHAARVRRYVDRHGIEKVEDFIDTCLSLENLIDVHAPFIERGDDDGGEQEAEDGEVPKFDAKSYMDEYINPDEFIEEQKRKMAEERERRKQVPSEPRKDVLMFLLQQAPLEDWEADVLSMIREEAYYFAPQKQTKIMNEGWACVAPETPVFTADGLVSMEAVVEGQDVTVSDGEAPRKVYDRNIFRDHETVTLRTRRGFELTGSDNHRVMLADGQWRRMDELETGDEIRVAGGCGLWPDEQVELHWELPRRTSLQDVADEAGVSLSTVIRYRDGQNIRRGEAVRTALHSYEAPENQKLPESVNGRADIRVPDRVDDDLAAFLGYMVGDGHVSRAKHHLGLTTGDDEQAARFAELAETLFDVQTTRRRDGNRWRVLAHSEHVSDFLTQATGLTEGPSAAKKQVPDVILRSPKSVQAAFLRALMDADGYAGEQGAILSTSSETLGRQVQLVLMNFGVLNRRREQSDGCWHVHVTGRSAERFADEIGFGLERKQEKLTGYLEEREWFKSESWTDEVVALEEGRGDVYDISVEETHRYAAAGLVNHNSYWHSKILTEEILEDSEIIDFADIHSGVMSASKGGFNPYKVGIELYRHIEERWDQGKFGKEWNEIDDMDRKANWDKQLGLGRDKIFEVRKLYNDVTFIDEFLTEEFVREQNLFTYEYNPKQDTWEIASRKFNAIKDKLLNMLTNSGEPFIYVRDGNFRNRGELLLHHKWDGTPLKMDYAQDVLQALERVWKRPVNLETKYEDEGMLLHFDGDDHEHEEWEYDEI